MSTIKVTNINPPTAGEAVNLNGLAYPTAGPLSNRNLIINGAMQVAQRGTSSTSTGYQTVDRYSTDNSSGTVTKTQESLSSGDPYDQGFRKFLRLTNTSAVSDTAAGYRNIYQAVEAQNAAQSGWNYTSSSSYITLSFWVRSSVSQEYYGSVQTSDGTAQKYPFSTGTLTANTWTKITKTIPGNSNITINSDNGVGLLVNISPFWGTNYTDSGVSVDTWASYSGSTRFPDFTSTWGTTASATFDITGVQLEVGQVATPFEHRSYGDELRRCQRYYCLIASSIGIIGTGGAYNTGNVWAFVPFPVDMRATPSLDHASGTNYYTVIGEAGTDPFNSLTLEGNTTSRAARISAQSGITVTQGSAYFIEINDTPAFVGFSSEL